MFTALSGTHQDAIKKGLDLQQRQIANGADSDAVKWTVPYIPIDPKDLGYGYDNLIRVSSQSGKAGAAYIVQQILGFDMPRRMQVAFYAIVQAASEELGKELTAPLVVDLFKRTFGLADDKEHSLTLCDLTLKPASVREPKGALSGYVDDRLGVEFLIRVKGQPRTLCGQGVDVLQSAADAVTSSFGVKTCVTDSHVQRFKEGRFAAYVEVSVGSGNGAWGIGISHEVNESQLRGLLSAIQVPLGRDEDTIGNVVA